jgi:hypothetical protein
LVRLHSKKSISYWGPAPVLHFIHCEPGAFELASRSNFLGETIMVQQLRSWCRLGRQSVRRPARCILEVETLESRVVPAGVIAVGSGAGAATVVARTGGGCGELASR